MSHLRDVVAPNMGESLGIFVAGRQPCIGIAAKPPADKRRSIRIEPSGLMDVDLPRSYAIAVVLCPGDDSRDLARFALERDVPDERLYFFYVEETDTEAALSAWVDAGRRVLYAYPIDGWKSLNRIFGAFWNHWIHDDHCDVPGCRMR